MTIYALKHRLLRFCIGMGLTLIAMAIWQSVPSNPPNIATGQSDDENVADADVEITGDNSYCGLCHSQEGRSITLADGAVLDLQVDPHQIAASVHGDSNEVGALGCLDCHGDITFPHTTDLPADRRSYTVNAMQICMGCHTQQGEELADGVHAAGLARGNDRAATCIDCHGSHEVMPVGEDRAAVTQTCGDCHTVVFAEYQTSVHGEALFEGDPNVPGCIDCHGVHGIDHPTTAQARNRSPQLCADCHADEDLMAQYDISTNVFESYLADFHGTTVALFDQQDPDVASNKAVCIDCHGVHNIRPADDTKSTVAKENLLATCQECHPNATGDFPDAWVGHFAPTAEDNPLLFGVNTFYKLLIPTVLGGFVVLVATDVYAQIRRRLFGRGNHNHKGGAA